MPTISVVRIYYKLLLVGINIKIITSTDFAKNLKNNWSRSWLNLDKPPSLKNKKNQKNQNRGKKKKKATNQNPVLGWLSSSFLYFYFVLFLFSSEGSLSKFSHDMDQLFFRFLEKFLGFLAMLIWFDCGR